MVAKAAAGAAALEKICTNSLYKLAATRAEERQGVLFRPVVKTVFKASERSKPDRVGHEISQTTKVALSTKADIDETSQ